MKIVLTGIAATPYAREYISNAARTLRERGHQVFVPHEGGWSAPADPTESNLFDLDKTYEALNAADTLIAVLDGYTVDDAVAAQIGVFYTLARSGDSSRRIIGILHDTRVAGWDWSGQDKALNPQIREMIRAYGAVYPSFKAVLSLPEAQAQ